MALAAFRVRSDGTVETAPIAGGSVGPCQKIRLRMSISYTTPGASGGTAAAFSGGRMVIHTESDSFSQDVTPSSGVPTIAPLADTAPGGCAVGGASFLASDLTADFVVSTHLADIVNGRITFVAEYGPEGTVAHFVGGDINDLVHGFIPITVKVDTLPSCSINPQSLTVCAGNPASFTASATGGKGPYTFSWTGPNGFTQTDNKVTNSTITINNAQAANAGTYTATVTDANTCTNVCNATLAVTPTPSCQITGDSPVCGGTTHTYASTLQPAGGTITHNWSIDGNGTINGPKDGPSVSVTAGASGSFTLTDNITRDGCPGQCTLSVPINPNPSCNISGDTLVCGGTMHTYTSTVSPAGGTLTHGWLIEGNGTITGPTNAPTVSVTADAFGS